MCGYITAGNKRKVVGKNEEIEEYCIIRDWTRKVLHVVCGRIGNCDSLKVETEALLTGLWKLKRIKDRESVVEGDSSIVIGWCLGKGESSWQLTQLVHKIRDILSCVTIMF